MDYVTRIAWSRERRRNHQWVCWEVGVGVLIMIWVSLKCCAACLSSDASALLDIQSTVDGYYTFPSSLSSWRARTDCCRHWAGVTCDRNTGAVSGLTVTSLDLVTNVFFRTFPAAECNLTELRSLSISQASFLSEIPPCLWEMESLQVLDLDALQFNSSGLVI
ncbi:hypothetical protein Mapa_012175 [Marchantia paleacea]|nr:hypothetical protein Mapa_012175 [Marchantia paleacea]